MIEAEQIEGQFDLHRIEHLVGRKILDADQYVAAHVAESLRQRGEGGARHRLEFGEDGADAPVQSRALLASSSLARFFTKDDAFLQREDEA